MLTYCTNIHPGESWDAVEARIHENVPIIQAGLAADIQGAAEPFPLSVWLSGRAARELDDDRARAFGDWCLASRCVVRSINGFPYGDFHGTHVKRRAYLPDWREAERLDYTERLARILARLLPGDVAGVISTVPLGFKAAEDWSAARQNILSALERLDRIAQESGKEIVLAIEAEPGCMLETTDEVIRFFDELRLPAALARHAGICFDCCHHAVEFESPAASLKRLTDAGVRIAQAHVTAALRVPGGELARLERFSEPVYLHQTIGRRSDGTLLRFADLPEALAAGADGRHIDEWRVHFHVPVFAAKLGDCTTTQPDLEAMLDAISPEVPLVVETYSFGVLPPDLQAATVAESVIRELRWVRDRARRSGKQP
jgi:hypothetical protein